MNAKVKSIKRNSCGTADWSSALQKKSAKEKNTSAMEIERWA